MLPEAVERGPLDRRSPVSVVDADPMPWSPRVVVAQDALAGSGIEVGEPVVDSSRIVGVLDGVEHDARTVRKLVLLVQPDVAVSHGAMLLGSCQ